MYYTSSGFCLTDNLVIKTLNDLILALKKLKEEVGSQVSDVQFLGEISGSHSDVYEDSCLLGYAV